jgi:hypothetical protein
MKIYSGGYGNGIVFVSPGAHYPNNSDWMSVGEADGKTIRKPIQFTVQFKAGVAEVPDSLGEYMIAQKLARGSPIVLITPPTILAADDLKPHYAKPIPVGRPMGEVLRQSAA